MSVQWRAVSTIGFAQIIASAASHYLPAVIAVQASNSLGVPSVSIFAGVSLALVVSAVLGPWAGRCVDRWGGRPVLMLSNLLFAIGLLTLGFAQGLIGIALAYVFIGAGLACGMFEVAFAALVRLFKQNARNAITGITLLAGFASFVGWTVSVYVESLFGWRGVCWFWAATHILIGLPLHAWLPNPRLASVPVATESDISKPKTLHEKPPTKGPIDAKQRWTDALLAFVFAASAFVGMGLMMHLPRLLQMQGVALGLAFTLGALVGPSQTLGRLFEFFFMRRWHPLISARLAALCHPVASVLLLMLGAPVAALFVVLHGIGNGILIIARGTLPLAIFGSHGYGARQGWLMLPAKIAQAAAPFLFGLALTHWGNGVLWMSSALGLLILLALSALSTQQNQRP
jgi:MFS family permease